MLKVTHDTVQVAETCQLALQRIERERDGTTAAGEDDASPYLSVDPMQAAPADTPTPRVRHADMQICMSIVRRGPGLDSSRM